MGRKDKYFKMVADLKLAIQIGRQCISEAVDLDEQTRQQYLNYIMSLENRIENLEEQYQNIRSFAYLEDYFLSPWNEDTGLHVENFWKVVSENNLGYKRKDVLGDVLKRKRIKNIHEYDYLVDGFVIFQQLGKMNETEARQIIVYMEDFQKKHKDNLF